MVLLWLFDNHLLVLNKFDGTCPVQKLQFTRCCFKVQLHGVPLFYKTKPTGERVGGTLGTVVDVDIPENGVGWGPFLRVRINMDITKPVQRGRLVTFKELGKMWVLFKYERLPWLCFHCGVIGHLERDCVSSNQTSSSSSGSVKQYGAWLRATESGGWRRGIGGDHGRRLHSVAAIGGKAKRAAFPNFEINRSSDLSGSNPHGKFVSTSSTAHHSTNIQEVSQTGSSDKVDVLSVKVGAMHANSEEPASMFVFATLHGKCNINDGGASVEHNVAHASDDVVGPATKNLEGVTMKKPLSKKFSKWLARAHGKVGSTVVEGPKQGADVCEVLQRAPETKRVKVSDGKLCSNNFLLAEAATQPRRSP
jgi:hypothetical protein